MSLSPALCTILKGIAAGVLNGSLSPKTNYGTVGFKQSLQYNGPHAELVRVCLDEEIQRLTNGERTVVFADMSHAWFNRSGLTFACVPTGEDARSLQAIYFGVAAATNGVAIEERKTTEE